MGGGLGREEGGGGLDLPPDERRKVGGGLDLPPDEGRKVGGGGGGGLRSTSR